MSAATAPVTSVDEAPLTVRAQRHPGRWAGGAVVLLLTAEVLWSMTSNPRFEWDVVADYLFARAILVGLLNTVQLTVVAMIAGSALGTVLAVLRLSPNPVVSGVVGAYVWVFRATPLLVQLLFWYNLAALYPSVALAVPFGGPALVEVPAEQLISVWTAALLGLSLHQAAYTAEIVRAGILSVDAGQREAATALGMSHLLTLRRIVLPQAMRSIVPPMGNEVISMMKTTSLVSIIAVPELLNTAQTIYARTYQTIPLLIVATLYYLALTALLTAGQSLLERRFGRGTKEAR
ncbi:amino acid ABC transporter permease [Cryptosporangium sp. NPDC048952]|uniref:amino acid ABC transporter permease n=1 Tax=Cryptosporangium sp. NPDC048952 TaxID=3363961 RepID=UPI003710152C